MLHFEKHCYPVSDMTPVVLIVDDDDCYEILLPRILRNAQRRASVQFVHDGEEARRYLSGDGEYSDRDRFPFPTVVLLDLNMPRVNGFELLEWKREHPELRSLPVAVWSSSRLPEEVAKAKSLGALSFIEKPFESEKIPDVFKELEILVSV